MAKYLDRCKKTRVVNCKGSMPDAPLDYGEWAYWCKDKQDGWHAKPCEHQCKAKGKGTSADEDRSPLTRAAKLFLYECPGGMAENKKRDECLRCAGRDEKRKRPRFNVLENLIRAAFFQGQQQGREQAAEAIKKLG